ncbi:MAG: hypothetical protein IPH08_03445 [Rhodocyclaceae bacterium]|nr:hypothetical protein [Rhodocyclaceae bacterium]MBK6906216.1 hypothetical protein [Rhodocyclaceae bacterium]
MNHALRTLWLIAAVLLNGCTATAQQRPESASARLATAEAMFAERCKKAGVFIHRTAENVEGIFLLKVRPENEDPDFNDQFRLNDPYGKDLNAKGYIMTFVRGSYQAQTKGTPAPGSPPRLGYRYVDALDPKDGKRYRYTGSVREVEVTAPLSGITVKRTKFVLDQIPAPDPASRYGVTYDDISTPEEREYWIAGSSLKVIDLQTNEVMAERIGYMMDRGQGNDSGGRSPWLFAADNACPEFAPRNGSRAQPYQSLDFTESVLKPKREN